MSTGALSCPSCGAVHVPRNPGVLVIVCDRCDTTLYREGDVLRAGRQAVLAEPPSRVAVGRDGRVGDVSFAIVGRMRFSWGGGAWDEWYVEANDGRGLWLVEDERRYSVEEALDALPPGAHAGLKVGDTLEFEGSTYEVVETGHALCEGGQGQLPRPVFPGENFAFVDLHQHDGDGRLLLEFDPDGTGRAFLGAQVDASAVSIVGAEAPPPPSATEADALKCPNCGSAVNLPKQGEPAVTVACSACDAVLDLDAAQLRLAGFRPQTPKFELEVGDRGQVLGKTWEVVGRIQYVDEEGYKTHEFLCWSEQDGYLWLEQDDRHWVAMRPATKGPTLSQIRKFSKGAAVSGGWRISGVGFARVGYVDGALPWRAAIGEGNKYVDLAKGRQVYSLDVGESEVERFEGNWVPGKELLKSFKRLDRWRAPVEAHAAAPNPWVPWWPVAGVALLLAFFNLVFVSMSIGTGREIAQVRVPGTSDGKSEHESQPFRYDGGGVLGIRVDAPVDNAWHYAEVELVSEESDEPVALTGVEVEYYHGYEGGESWSEGSTHNTHYFKGPAAGTYRMVVTTEGDQNVASVVKLTAGNRLARYNLCLLSMFGILGVIPFVLIRGFETARWKDD